MSSFPLKTREVTSPPGVSSPLTRGKDNIKTVKRMKAEEEERIANAILSPDKFATYFLGDILWDKQIEIMQAVATKSRVAVKACHSSSKTFSAARIVLWFLARWTQAIVVTTAPTWGQVEKMLWGEIHSALQKSKYPFPKATMTELKIAPKRYAYGLSTSVTKQDEGVKFQGFHAEHVLVVLDEAPGVDPKIWEAIEGARAGGQVTVLAIGNPTISSGPFHDAFSKDRSGWECFTIDAFDTPNLRGLTLEELLQLPDSELDNNVTPYLTTRRWVKEKYYEWGENHPSWESRVRGNFPKQSEDALLNLTWLEQAKIRELPDVGDVVAGLDVAGPGENETTLVIRKGPRIFLNKSWSLSDPRGYVVDALNPFRGYLKAVNVDSIGIGWGMYQHLLDLKFPAIPINVSEASSDQDKYYNQKAEFYWHLRSVCESGQISGLADDITIGQLAGIRYEHDSKGRIKIESKEDATARGVKSPDRAEAVMLAFAERTAIYGVLDFARQYTAEQLAKNNSSKELTALVCTRCESSCVVKTNNTYRCNNCGNQWFITNINQQPKKVLTRVEVLQRMLRR